MTDHNVHSIVHLNKRKTTNHVCAPGPLNSILTSHSEVKPQAKPIVAHMIKANEGVSFHYWRQENFKSHHVCSLRTIALFSNDFALVCEEPDGRTGSWPFQKQCCIWLKVEEAPWLHGDWHFYPFYHYLLQKCYPFPPPPVGCECSSRKSATNSNSMAEVDGVYDLAFDGKVW